MKLIHSKNNSIFLDTRMTSQSFAKSRSQEYLREKGLLAKISDNCVELIPWAFSETCPAEDPIVGSMCDGQCVPYPYIFPSSCNSSLRLIVRPPVRPKRHASKHNITLTCLSFLTSSIIASNRLRSFLVPDSTFGSYHFLIVIPFVWEGNVPFTVKLHYCFFSCIVCQQGREGVVHLSRSLFVRKNQES